MSDPHIDKIRKDYGLGERDVWELPQKRGTYLIKHSAVEAIVAKVGIVFDMPIMLEINSAEGIASLIVRGTLGDRSEWSIGECSPKNNRNAYPLAMSEKRAKDRVALKLAGLHGLFYSEDEITKDDDREFPQGDFVAGPNAAASKSSAELKRQTRMQWEDEFKRELFECDSLIKWEKHRQNWKAIADRDGWNTSFRHAAQELLAQQKDHIMSQMSPDALSKLPLAETLKASVQRPLNDDFPGDR